MEQCTKGEGKKEAQDFEKGKLHTYEGCRMIEKRITTYCGVDHQLLDEEPPVVKVVVHPEVTCLIDVTQQPHLLTYVAHMMRFYEYT